MQQTASAPAELREKAEWPAEVAAQVRELRRERGESGEEFGAVIGLSKGKVSELECGKFRPNVACALLIEALSMQDGTPRIDAADLNDDVRASRHGQSLSTLEAQDHVN